MAGCADRLLTCFLRGVHGVSDGDEFALRAFSKSWLSWSSFLISWLIDSDQGDMTCGDVCVYSDQNKNKNLIKQDKFTVTSSKFLWFLNNKSVFMYLFHLIQAVWNDNMFDKENLFFILTLTGNNKKARCILSKLLGINRLDTRHHSACWPPRISWLNKHKVKVPLYTQSHRNDLNRTNPLLTCEVWTITQGHQEEKNKAPLLWRICIFSMVLTRECKIFDTGSVCLDSSILCLLYK